MKTVLFFLLLLAPFCLSAQIGKKGSMNISIGADGLLPSGTFATTHRNGFGGTLKSEYVFARHVSATLAGSYLSFQDREGDALRLLPLLAGLRYYVGNFYISAEGGSGFQQHPAHRSAFLYAFAAGDEIITGPGGNSLDLSLRIQTWNSESRTRFYSLRLVYEFRL